MDIATFFEENYIWIIVVGIIILMTIIGYFADKTNFGSKEKTVKEKPVKEEPNKEENSNDLIETYDEKTVIPEIEETSLDQFQMPNIEASENKVQHEEETNDLEQEEPNLEEKEQQPVEEIKPVQLDELPENDFNESNNQDEFNEEEKSGKDFDDKNNKSLEQQTDSKDNDSISDGLDPVAPEETDFELPSIDKLNEEISNVDDDEDVWKF